MILWSGWGWLVPVAVFVSSLIFEAVSESATGSDRYYQQNPWLFALAMLLAGAVVWFAARHFDQKPAQVFIEKETGREVVLRSSPTFFFVPMRYWAGIVPALGVGYFLYQTLSAG